MNTNKIKATTCLIAFALLVGIVWNALGIYFQAPTAIVQGGGAGVSAACIWKLRDFWNKKFNV